VQGNSPGQDITRLGELRFKRKVLFGAISPMGDIARLEKIPFTTFLKTHESGHFSEFHNSWC